MVLLMGLVLGQFWGYWAERQGEFHHWATEQIIVPPNADYNGGPQDVQQAYCWAHARRTLHGVATASAGSIAHKGQKQIAALYRIEAEDKGQSADTRHDRTEPELDTFEKWLTFSRAQVSAKPPTGQALKYIIKYWEGLNLFMTDGRVEPDNNPVERTIRPIAINRKNALFAGHEAGSQNRAMLASLIETCKLNAVAPHAYISGTLTAIVNRHKQSDIEDLLPWNFYG